MYIRVNEEVVSIHGKVHRQILIFRRGIVMIILILFIFI